ncbi:MAG: hypothetical protein ACRC6B_09515, partial [Fusobacteriaceae bacterium]
MIDFNKYPTISNMNKNLNGEISYSIYAHGIAYKTWFDEFGFPTDSDFTLGPIFSKTAKYNYSGRLTEEGFKEGDFHLKLYWKQPSGAQFHYKGLLAIGDEIIYIDTNQLTKKPTAGLGNIRGTEEEYIVMIP